MRDRIAQYYRCPERYVQLKVGGALSGESGYFGFRSVVVSFGQLCRDWPTPTPNERLCNTMIHVISEGGVTFLPFVASQVAENLKQELYKNIAGHGISILDSMPRNLYYLIRPLLPVAVRQHLQKAWLTNRSKRHFPK